MSTSVQPDLLAIKFFLHSTLPSSSACRFVNHGFGDKTVADTSSQCVEGSCSIALYVSRDQNNFITRCSLEGCADRMERVLHSVLTCRVVLHIHSMSNRPLFSTDSFSKLSYQSENAINLGGPHAHSWTPRSQQNLQSASKSDMNNANTTRNEATRSVKGMRIVFSQE